MFDLNALIVPSESAADVRLGQSIKEILIYQKPFAMIELNDCNKYEFDSIYLWIKDEKIIQIGVFGNYQGHLKERICIGSTIREVQTFLGKIEEDQNDCLVVYGMSGWCFDTEEWNESHNLEQNLDRKITEIHIFP